MTDPKVEWSAEFTVPADDSKGLLGIKFEDSGNAAIMYLPEADPVERGGDGCFFVRLHSWDASLGKEPCTYSFKTWANSVASWSLLKQRQTLER